MRLRIGAMASITLALLLGTGTSVVRAATLPPLPGGAATQLTDLSGLRPMIRFASPQAGVAEAPGVATLAIEGPAGRFHVPYIQTSADLRVAVVHNGPAARSIVDIVLDAGTPQTRAIRLTSPPWRATFRGLDFGEHTLTARLYAPEEGIPSEIALAGPPVAQAHLEQVARGDVVAALGDSTTEGLGEGPWRPGEQERLGFFPDWLAAARSLTSTRPDWITPDGRNFPQAGLTIHPASRPAFTVELARQLAATRGHPVLVLNEGWSGTTSDGYMRISTSTFFAHQVAATSPDEWLINLGVNDPLVNRSAAEYGNRLRELVDNLRRLYAAAPGNIHVACPIYAKQPARDQAERHYLPEVDQLRAQQGLGAAPNFFAFFRDHPEGVADAVHPNFAGYSAMARLWAAALAGQAQGCAG